MGYHGRTAKAACVAQDQPAILAQPQRTALAGHHVIAAPLAGQIGLADQFAQIVDFDDLNQTPFYNVYSHLVYATKDNDVRTVIINGRVVMLDRRLLTLNENVIKIDANAYRKKIIESLKN